jgi:hypothetical protein
MAKIWVTEYRDIGWANYSNPLMIPSEVQSVRTQVVDFSSGEAKTAQAFLASTKFVRIWADTDCCTLIDKTPTATTSSTPRAAKSPEYIQVQPGDKLSAITLG